MNTAAMTSCGLRRRIAAYDFALVEMNLYLDTHPADCEALELMYAYRRKRDELVAAYEQQFGAYEIMARDVENRERWSWIDTPWPWEIA